MICLKGEQWFLEASSDEQIGKGAELGQFRGEKWGSMVWVRSRHKTWTRLSSMPDAHCCTQKLLQVGHALLD